MDTEEQIRDTILKVGAVLEEFTPRMFAPKKEEYERVSDVLVKMEQQGEIQRCSIVPPTWRLTSKGQEKHLGVYSSYPEIKVKSVNYGPSEKDGEWCLTFTTQVGDLILYLDDAAMHDLWVEVKDVPWSRGSTDKKDELLNEVILSLLFAEQSTLERVQSLVATKEQVS